MIFTLQGPKMLSGSNNKTAEGIHNVSFEATEKRTDQNR